MTDQQHRATPQQWRDVRACADDIVTYSTILELLHRIEALEAAAQPAKSNQLEIPDSSLLSRVAAVVDNGTACDREPERIARDAIRAVAAWLREQRLYGVGALWQRLVEEAER